MFHVIKKLKHSLVQQPKLVCHECGIKYGRKVIKDHISTYHIGTCDVCNQETSVTEPRDFGYLDREKI